MPSGPRPPPTENSASARAVASKFRRRLGGIGHPLTPDEVEWLAAYEEAHPQAARGQSIGASRSRKLTHTEEETEAVGTGDAAAAAASASRAEGQRLDYITEIGTQALVRACTLHERMAAALLARAIQDGETIRQLTDSARTNALALTQHQADTILRDAEREAEEKDSDGMSKLVEELLPQLMPLLRKKLEAK